MRGEFLFTHNLIILRIEKVPNKPRYVKSINMGQFTENSNEANFIKTHPA